jgi:hypothetical protein
MHIVTKHLNYDGSHVPVVVIMTSDSRIYVSHNLKGLLSSEQDPIRGESAGGGLPGLKPPYPGRAIGAPLSPPMNLCAIGNREGGARGLEALTEVEDDLFLTWAVFMGQATTYV